MRSRAGAHAAAAGPARPQRCHAAVTQTCRRSYRAHWLSPPHHPDDLSRCPGSPQAARPLSAIGPRARLCLASNCTTIQCRRSPLAPGSKTAELCPDSKGSAQKALKRSFACCLQSGTRVSGSTPHMEATDGWSASPRALSAWALMPFPQTSNSGRCATALDHAAGVAPASAPAKRVLIASAGRLSKVCTGCPTAEPQLTQGGCVCQGQVPW